jgi:hypothetical protein
VLNIKYIEFSTDNPVQRSLSAIKEARERLNCLNEAAVNANTVACQIELYDQILCEILDIRAELKRGFAAIRSNRRHFKTQLRYAHRTLSN